MSPMIVLADQEDLVTTHRIHGQLMPEVSQPTPNGYMLEVACSCGVVFMRWVTPEDAALRN